MLIPPDKIQKDTLDNILEEFINREGTDYGEQELSLADKVAALRPKILKGDFLIVFDEKLESITLMTPTQYRAVEQDYNKAQNPEAYEQDTYEQEPL